MERGISSMGFHRRTGTRNNGGSLQRMRKDHRHYRVLEVWGSSGCVAPKRPFLLTFFGQ